MHVVILLCHHKLVGSLSSQDKDQKNPLRLKFCYSKKMSSEHPSFRDSAGLEIFIPQSS